MNINGVGIRRRSIKTPDIFLTWHRNGQKDWYVEYKNRVHHGRDIYWDNKGYKVWDLVWRNGTVIKDNLR